MTQAVRLERVCKAFRPGRPVLAGLDLDVPAGGSLALLGPSGSGKSTVLRIVAGLERPDAGRVLLGGRVVADPAPRVAPEQRGVGMVFQDLELWPHLTVAENVAFGLAGRPRGRRASEAPRVRALAERLGVDGLLARRPDALSGGERQRVALARTLAPAPGVLLLDEPLASLDAERRADLVGVLSGAARESGATLLLVTHDAAEALTLGAEIAVLAQGRVVERGEPQRLLREPRSAAAARALGHANVLPAQRDGRTWRCALGSVEIEAAAEGTSHVLLAPDAVRPASEGAPATVLAAWPLVAGWAFRAAVGEAQVEGRSPGALAPGAAVRLVVHGAGRGLTGLPEREAA